MQDGEKARRLPMNERPIVTAMSVLYAGPLPWSFVFSEQFTMTPEEKARVLEEARQLQEQLPHVYEFVIKYLIAENVPILDMCERACAKGELIAEYLPIVDIYERALGPEHLQTLRHVRELAFRYFMADKYADAIILFKRLLKQNEKTQGATPSGTLHNMRLLADLYRLNNQPVEAELLYARILDIYETEYGSDHPLTADALVYLAKYYKKQGQEGEAMPLYQRALEIYERAFGSEHSSCVVALDNLAGIYYQLGHYSETVVLHRRSLKIRASVFGGEVEYQLARRQIKSHGKILDNGKILDGGKMLDCGKILDTVSKMLQDAQNLGVQGHYAEAEPLFLHVLKVREAIHGQDYTGTVESLYCLAWLYHKWGQFEQAEPFYLRAMEGCKLLFRVEDANWRRMQSEYLTLLLLMGRDEEAEALFPGSVARHRAWKQQNSESSS